MDFQVQRMQIYSFSIPLLRLCLGNRLCIYPNTDSPILPCRLKVPRADLLEAWPYSSVGTFSASFSDQCWKRNWLWAEPGTIITTLVTASLGFRASLAFFWSRLLPPSMTNKRITTFRRLLQLRNHRADGGSPFSQTSWTITRVQLNSLSRATRKEPWSSKSGNKILIPPSILILCQCGSSDFVWGMTWYCWFGLVLKKVNQWNNYTGCLIGILKMHGLL